MALAELTSPTFNIFVRTDFSLESSKGHNLSISISFISSTINFQLGLSYKTFYSRNLGMFVISQRVCP